MQTTQNIIGLFLDCAEKNPEQIALIDKNGRAYSYQELRTQVESRAAYLYKHGLRSGDEVLICCGQDIDLIRNVLALFYLGAIAVYPGDWTQRTYLEKCCQAQACKAMIAAPKARLMAYFSKPLRKIPLKMEAHSPNYHSIFPLAKVQEEQNALISFVQKEDQILALKRSHKDLHTLFQSLLEIQDPQAWEIAAHNSLESLLSYLSMGATSVMLDFKRKVLQKQEVEKLFQVLSLYKINRLNCDPAMLRALSDYLIVEVEDLADLQKVYIQGPAFPIQDAHLFTEALPRTEITYAYTAAQMPPLTTAGIRDILHFSKRDQGCYLGQKLGGVNIKLLDIVDKEVRKLNYQEFSRLLVPSGEIGEVLLKIDPIVQEKNPELYTKEEVLQVEGDLWYKSGDTARFKSGRLYYTGKKESLMEYKLKVLSPFMYEHYLQEINSIAQATLLELDGKLSIIIEARKENLQEKIGEELKHISLHFDQVIFVRKIPMLKEGSSGIDYTALKNMLKEGSINAAFKLD
ncbi:MAG: AMP-binding protein [Bacteroidia bacterium]|nr:AMP-binding protein [Bacteroidia bacterium]